MSLLVVVVAAGAVFVAAAPSILRAAGAPGSKPARVTGRHADPHYAAARTPPGSSPTPRFVFQDDDENPDPNDDAQKVDPDPALGPSGLHRAEDAPPGTHPPPTEKSLRMGLARKSLKLVANPEAGAEATGEVKAGDLIMVMREEGEWALVVYNGKDTVLMGWTRKSDIAVR